MNTKLYKVSSTFSTREINARSKKEAIEIFKRDLKTLINENDKIEIK